MNDTALATTEPHRRYLARLYAEAKAWRRGFPPSFTGTRTALNAYIRSLRNCWAIERRFKNVFVTVNH